MSAAKAARSSLPDGWELCESKSTPGRQYYFNRKTGKSSWTEPKAETAHGASKQRSRKDKSSSQTKKEIIHKKSLKRKSDGHEQDYLYKKRKHETSLQRHRTEVAKEESPSKRRIDKSSPNKQTPSKNLANNRLTQLRAQLNAEVSQEETSNPETPKANRLKSSPKTSQSETPTKNKKPDDKSPNSNDSKCSTTVQSPSNESLHSIPSPSQFFTANKIISSMKAQLPDEFGKTEQIDTFASIEQGINNQTIEFPYSKHPATPPQFSQASKLVSAIKSKLSYSPGDSIRTFKTACERMEALRTSLSSEANESNSFIESSFISNPKEIISQINEAMDIEEYKKIEVSAPKVVEIDASQSSCEQNVTLVVDTNIFIHELDLIKNVLNSHIKGYSEQPILLVPWRVINELDRLKDNNNGNGAICKRARAAMDYLYKSLPENSRIKGQSLRDSNSHIYPCELPDDEILNCCLQQAERGKSVILLSNDKNLCSKATVNGIKSKSLDELKCLLESKPQDVVDPELSTCLKYCQDTVYQLLSNILENEMRAKYNNLWEHVIFKAPPWTLSDVLQCLLKHWIAVFTDVFPRIEHLILDLKNSLSSIENKDVKSLSQSEVSNFKELCIDVAKRCQIIPEYMDLAKLTVERLERGSDRDSDYNEREMVIDAFEKVWTVFSSYCSKVCTAMGIPHNIEDCLPNNESLEVLTTKLPVFAGHIAAFSVALNGVLTLETDDVRLDEMMSQLEETFKTCLIVIYVDSEMVNKESLKVFCANCRSMLQEASEKFAQLTELLQVCNSRIDIDINLN